MKNYRKLSPELMKESRKADAELDFMDALSVFLTPQLLASNSDKSLAKLLHEEFGLDEQETFDTLQKYIWEDETTFETVMRVYQGRN